MKNKLIFEVIDKLNKIEHFLCKNSIKNINMIEIKYFKEYFNNTSSMIEIIEILNKIITIINNKNTKNYKNSKNYKNLCNTLSNFKPIVKITPNDQLDQIINDIIDYLNDNIIKNINIILCS